MNKSKRVALCGIFTALAMIFGYIEMLIPIPIGVPGIKLGIANIVILVVIYKLGSTQGILVSFLRITLNSILFGNFYGFLFSIAGSFLSIASILIIKRCPSFSVVGVSVVGGLFHNIGQIIMAIFLLQNIGLVTYLPVLIITGIVTGTVVGIITELILERISFEI